METYAIATEKVSDIMDQQTYIDGLKEKDNKWATVMARVSLDEKRDIFLYCHSVSLNYSVLTRIIWKKILNNIREIPSATRPEPTKEIDNAINDAITYIPVIVQQRKFNSRMY